MIASATEAEQQLAEQAKRGWSEEVRQAVGCEDAHAWSSGTLVALPRKSGAGALKWDKHTRKWNQQPTDELTWVLDELDFHYTSLPYRPKINAKKYVEQPDRQDFLL